MTPFVFVPSDEDIHTAVERRLTPDRWRSAQIALRSQSQRSGSDRSAALGTAQGAALAASLVQLHGTSSIVPPKSGLPICLVTPIFSRLSRFRSAHHLLAHSWAIERDVDRLGDALAPMSHPRRWRSLVPVCPSIPSSPLQTLGFAATFSNSLGAVSDRDFVAEMLFVCAGHGAPLPSGEEPIPLVIR